MVRKFKKTRLRAPDCHRVKVVGKAKMVKGPSIVQPRTTRNIRILLRSLIHTRVTANLKGQLKSLMPSMLGS